jgi:hypothetical protein
MKGMPSGLGERNLRSANLTPLISLLKLSRSAAELKAAPPERAGKAFQHTWQKKTAAFAV